MSESNGLREFYETTLLPELRILDRERKQVDRKIIIVGLVGLVLIFAVGW